MELTRKFFPRETLDEKENAFQDICKGTQTVREYELEFGSLRRFTGRVMDEEELIRRFMKGLREDIRSRCSLREYRSMVKLVENAAIQEVGLAEEQKLI
ncbi:hypothetical protein V5N11_031799 [Cardamine amara subsp. amara]|uniref:Retrotransposon gag domain-containing protein n=1 Tax=Cardamine amara subsp. amara TaxID=228776 RepID=A0ABD1BS81_CARAN